jgi:predicted metalloprotease with PDZ domain
MLPEPHVCAKWNHSDRPAVIWLLALLLMQVPSLLAAPLSLRYHLILSRPSTHLMEVEIDVSGVASPTLDFIMPAWAPGRYAIYNFAKNVQQFEAVGAQGQALSWLNADKETWRVDTANAGGAVTVRYKVYADDLTGSFSQFDPTHASLNGAGIYMYVAGHKPDPVTLTIQPPSSWSSGFKIIDGFSDSTTQANFQVPNYDRLIDTPIEICQECTISRFEDHGKTFRVAVHAYAGLPETNRAWTASLAQGLQKVVHSEMSMMPAPDFQEYTFIYYVTPFVSLGDGMEHLNSTEIVVRGIPDDAALSEALELGAHEFFHLWNVKRMRPAGLGPFDYTHEVYTRSLWFVEGVTDYYAFLNLYRAGIWSQQQLLQRLASEIRQLRQDPGRTMMSAESSSFDAWFYDRAPQMQQTNFANSTISYYNKGALLGMLFDLEIRERTGGKQSLDDVLRAMYRKFYDAPAATYYLPGKGYRESDILQAMNDVSGSDFTSFFNQYVRGTAALPCARVLAAAGLELSASPPANSPPSLGALTQLVENGYEVMAVRPGGPADRAGLSVGDILIDVDGLSLIPMGLETRLGMYPAGSKVPFMVQRYDQRIIKWVTLAPPTPNDYRISINPMATPQQLRIWEGWLATPEKTKQP